MQANVAGWNSRTSRVSACVLEDSTLYGQVILDDNSTKRTRLQVQSALLFSDDLKPAGLQQFGSQQPPTRNRQDEFEKIGKHRRSYWSLMGLLRDMKE
jgi:hypothetical protein